MKERLLKLLIKVVPQMAKIWERMNGNKTKAGAIEFIIGVGFGVFGVYEIGVPLVISGFQQMIIGLSHKAYKHNNNKNKE